MYQLVCYLVRRVTGRCIKVFRFKIFFCGFCFYSGRKSPSDERAAKDPSQNAEETFLFGSSSISSLSVAGTSLTSSPFGQKASTSSPGFAGPSSLVFAANATGDHDESAPNSGVPVTFNCFGQGGNASEQRVRGNKVSFSQTPSCGAGISFGSPKSSQSDTKPTCSFGSISQTPNLSSGVPGSFGSFGQGGNVSEQKVEKKIPFSSAFKSTEAGPFSPAMQSAERGYCFRSTTSTAGAGFSFAPTPSTAGAGVFGSTTSTVGTGGLFVSTSAQSTHPMFSFPLTMPSTSSS